MQCRLEGIKKQGEKSAEAEIRWVVLIRNQVDNKVFRRSAR